MKTVKKAFVIGAMLVASIVVGGTARAKDQGARAGLSTEGEARSEGVQLASKDKHTSEKQHPPLNACGCYRKDEMCVCTSRTVKCDCPGECEPVGCEQKRQKQIERELAEETKKIQDEHRKREEAEKAKLAPKPDPEDTEEEVVPEPPKHGKGKASKGDKAAKGEKADKAEKAEKTEKPAKGKPAEKSE